MKGNFSSLKKPLLFQEVQGQIQESINSGAFQPGDKLPSERELIDKLKVSRVTVREALRALQSQGVIEVKRGVYAGAYVAKPNPRAIINNFQNLVNMGKVGFPQLIDSRLHLEPEITRTVAKIRTSEDLQRLSLLLERAESLLKKSRKKARLTNVRFHCEVAIIIQNPIIIFITESISQVFSALLIDRTQHRLGTEKIHKLINEHREILKAIEERDGDQAFELSRRHLLRTRNMYTDIFPKNKTIINSSEQKE
jgi:GntR family transcriptional repressor for pyruvate dehydrogenase complex